MKKCHLCGYDNQDNAQFCLSCGSSLQITAQQEPQSNDNQNVGNTYQPDSNPQFEQQDIPQQNNQQNSYNQYDNNQYNNGPVNNGQYNNGPYNNNQYNNGPYNAGQNPYPGGYNTPVNQKNKTVAALLSGIAGFLFYFLSGLGQLYLGLVKRGLILCAIGFVPIILNFMFYGEAATIGILVLGIAYVIYCAYDAYICAEAINQGRAIPLLFTAFDIQ